MQRPISKKINIWLDASPRCSHNHHNSLLFPPITIRHPLTFLTTTKVQLTPHWMQAYHFQNFHIYNQNTKNNATPILCIPYCETNNLQHHKTFSFFTIKDIFQRFILFIHHCDIMMIEPPLAFYNNLSFLNWNYHPSFLIKDY
jgi:hypothetical protein